MSLDLIKSSLEHVADRVKDPFLGIYSFFVLVINWQIWIYLFSDLSSEHKIEKISVLLKANHYQSTWKPLLFSIIFLLLSLLMRTLFKFLIQLYQRFDDWIVKLPMDQEKIKLITQNSRLTIELDEVVRKNEELVKLNTFIMSFLTTTSEYRSDIMVSGNEAISRVSGFQNVDSYSKDSVNRILNNSVTLCNRIEEFRTNVNLINKR